MSSKDDFPRTEKLAAATDKNPADMSDQELAHFKNRAFKAIRADSLEKKVRAQQKQYEEDEARSLERELNE